MLGSQTLTPESATNSTIRGDGEAMSFKCEVCGKTFQTPQALASHIHYVHERRKEKKLKELATPTPTPPAIKQVIEQDPEIIDLEKRLRKMELQKKIRELEDVPKLVEVAERVTRLEDAVKKTQESQTLQTQELSHLSTTVSSISNELTDLKELIKWFVILYYLHIHPNLRQRGALASITVNRFVEALTKAFPNDEDIEALAALST
jgi:IS30 family transposase